MLIKHPHGYYISLLNILTIELPVVTDSLDNKTVIPHLTYLHIWVNVISA